MIDVSTLPMRVSEDVYSFVREYFQGADFFSLLEHKVYTLHWGNMSVRLLIRIGCSSPTRYYSALLVFRRILFSFRCNCFINNVCHTELLILRRLFRRKTRVYESLDVENLFCSTIGNGGWEGCRRICRNWLSWSFRSNFLPDG